MSIGGSQKRKFPILAARNILKCIDLVVVFVIENCRLDATIVEVLGGQSVLAVPSPRIEKNLSDGYQLDDWVCAYVESYKDGEELGMGHVGWGDLKVLNPNTWYPTG